MRPPLGCREGKDGVLTTVPSLTNQWPDKRTLVVTYNRGPATGGLGDSGPATRTHQPGLEWSCLWGREGLVQGATGAGQVSRS